MPLVYAQIAMILLCSVNAYCFWAPPASPNFLHFQGQKSNLPGVGRPALIKFAQRESKIPLSITSLPAVESFRTPEKKSGTASPVLHDEMEQMAQQTAKSAVIGLCYDPREAGGYWSSSTLQVWKQDMEISVPITTFLGKVLIDYQQGMEDRNHMMRAREFKFMSI